MSKQVLIINVTRMGDLVQTIPLLGRLHHEWPGVAIDLIVDNTFAPMAALLPGIRHVLAYDFQGLMDQCRTMAKDVVCLFQEFSEWARPLIGTRYDRVINLTFTRRSGLLAAYIGASDIRGATTTPDGVSVLHNPWMTYFADMHRHRRFNRFNLVDLYALGGSGPGPHAPLTLSTTPDAREWAEHFLNTKGNRTVPIAVQIGASDAMKAWRPEYFGRTMAVLSKQAKIMFVLIGTKGEAEAVQQAVTAYRACGGVAMIHDAAGQTDLAKLAALLARCRLLLTNDTGPMHVAVGVGTSVVDLSVGHVDFNETGPYGRGHWVVQPDLECAPCGFEQVCPHHACKDRLIPDQVAALCLHVLGGGAPFPNPVTGVRLYESGIDEDGLACYRLRTGRVDPTSDWYGRFWRKYWYNTFTGQLSKVRIDEPPPDLANEKALFTKLDPVVTQLVERTANLVHLSRRHPLPVETLKSAQAEVTGARRRALEMAMPSPAFGPTTVALLRALQNGDGMELPVMAEQQAMAYSIWGRRVRAVMEQLDAHQSIFSRSRVFSASTRIPLLMP